MIIDLGCGKNKFEGTIGVDRVPPPMSDADVLCTIGFEPLPFEDSSVDVVIAKAFVEHIPFVVWGIDGSRVMPMVYLFNDVYRILKPQGVFKVRSVPLVNPPNQPMNPIVFVGIEHISHWTWETPNFFSDDYYGLYEDYGHTSHFRCENKGTSGGYMAFDMVAVK